MAVYRFDSELACEYGINESIFIYNMSFWVAKNKESKKNLFDGKTWTYNTIKAFSEIFPFWSNQTIRTTINSLVKKNVIISGNYNKAGYDRTKWYAFADETSILSHMLELTNGFVETNKWICENQQMDLLESTNGVVRINKPIPDIKPNNKPDIKPNIPYDEIIEMILSIPNAVKPRKITDTHKSNIKARWNKEGKSIEVFKEVIGLCNSSKFLCGKVKPSEGRKQFKISIDWILNKTNWDKVISGKYQGDIVDKQVKQFKAKNPDWMDELKQ